MNVEQGGVLHGVDHLHEVAAVPEGPRGDVHEGPVEVVLILEVGEPHHVVVAETINGLWGNKPGKSCKKPFVKLLL